MGNNNSSIKYKLPDTNANQLEKLKNEFEKYDKNRNQVLEKEELEIFLEDNIPDLLEFSQIIMDLFGSGKKKTISFDKFQIFYNSLQYIGKNEQDPLSLPMLIFKKLDKNDNYYISYKEIKYLLNLLPSIRSNGKVTKKDAIKIIHDQNPAREEWGLSRDEFIKFFDSYISSDAMEEAADHMREFPSDILAVGLNKKHQIGSENSMLSRPTSLKISGGPEWNCIAAGGEHTVIITGSGIVYGLGSNSEYQLGGSENEYKCATPLVISNKPIKWAACGKSFTVYLDEDGKLIFCGPVCVRINPTEPRPFVVNEKLKKKFVYVSACSEKFCAIESSGKIYIYGSDPRQRPQVNKLSVPAYDVACGYSNISGKFYAIAVTVSGKAYGFDGLNNDFRHFSPIDSLSGFCVKKVFGHSNHLAVLTGKGQILTYGNGAYGQCGNGTNESNISFKLVQFNNDVEFDDIALGENHSIFISKDGDAFACGNNQHCQLCLGITKKAILYPTLANLIGGKVVGAACGSSHTLILTHSKKIQHPGMLYFGIKQN